MLLPSPAVPSSCFRTRPFISNTLGVVQIRAWQYAQAIATMERSIAAAPGEFDAFGLFFMAVAHHRLGERDQAHACFDRALIWIEKCRGLPDYLAKDLAISRAEAETVLAGPAGELPSNPFMSPP